RFSSILVDAQLGGGGARRVADGADTAGLLHSPGATTSNIELNERNFPVLYLHRLERADSGGPGTTRGGVGSEHAWVARDEIDLVLFGHGMQQPTSAGFAGGEHGRQNAFLLERDCTTGLEGLVRGDHAGGRREVPPPKLITTMGRRDVFTSWCAGGGGMGDPLDRDPEAVRLDAEEGLVSPQGAASDYGVVLRDGSVDRVATAELRHARRVDRLGGAEPAPRWPAPAPGRRIGACLVLTVDGQLACRLCGRPLGSAERNVKESLLLSEVPTWERWPLSEEYEGARRFVLRRYFCPGCAVQMFVEVNRPGAPPVWSVEPAIPGPTSPRPARPGPTAGPVRGSGRTAS
ncbi:MAG TPA: hydantoinase B/oxoprolinase family protein, partial [Acidimicrobiales bacterium]|nr:hydantoinase B/oxoprolinase family protein [Acidimicrobiales bacterium]